MFYNAGIAQRISLPVSVNPSTNAEKTGLSHSQDSYSFSFKGKSAKSANKGDRGRHNRTENKKLDQKESSCQKQNELWAKNLILLNTVTGGVGSSEFVPKDKVKASDDYKMIEIELNLYGKSSNIEALQGNMKILGCLNESLKRLPNSKKLSAEKNSNFKFLIESMKTALGRIIKCYDVTRNEEMKQKATEFANNLFTPKGEKVKS